MLELHTNRHYKRASGALLVYDVTSRSSFENAEKVWLRELKNAADSNSSLLESLVLVGNKVGKSMDNRWPHLAFSMSCQAERVSMKMLYIGSPPRQCYFASTSRVGKLCHLLQMGRPLRKRHIQCSKFPVDLCMPCVVSMTPFTARV